MSTPEEIAAAISSWRVLSVYASEGVKAAGNELARLLRAANPSNSSNSSPEPATPAVGEDAGADCECTCASELAEKVRVLLADVARLQKELDGATFREERYAEDAVGARLALEDARATLDALFRYRERTRGWSAEYNTFSDTIAAEEGIE